MLALRITIAVSIVSLAGCGGSSSTTQTPSTDQPAASPAPAWFEEVATARGVDFIHDSGHDGKTFLFPEIVCGGVAVLDVEGDGDLDIYLVQSGSVDTGGPNKLYLNDGAGSFTDATEGSGAGDHGYGVGVATGDYDGDGDLDIYVTNLDADKLLRNEGDGTFTDVTRLAGIDNAKFGASASFVDYDADGDLDLFVVNYIHWSRAEEMVCNTPFGGLDYCSPNQYTAPAGDVLYRNDGDGTFTDVTFHAGLRAAFGNGLGVVCGDLDDDGLPEIFVANDKMPNQLWRNQGNGTFRDVSMEAGCAVDRHGLPKAGMGTVMSDVDDDGDLDVLVVNLGTESDSLFINEDGWFNDGTAAAGLGGASRRFTRFGLALTDFDQDGYVDLYEANGRVRAAHAEGGDDPYAEVNLLMRGTGDGRFEPVGDRGGTADALVATSRGAAFGDLDGDGAVDIVVANRDGPAHVLLNRAPNRGKSVMLSVIGATGGHALGARVDMTLGQRRLRRDVRTDGSYCAASDPRIHVGLGDEPGIGDVVVRWPDGIRESFGTVSAGMHTLRRGSGTIVEVDA